LAVSDNPTPHQLVDTVIAAAVQAGIEENEDQNGAIQDGVGRWQSTQRDGRRSSTAAGYLGPVRGRPNLGVITDAEATEIDFVGDRAVGVQFLRHGEPQAARCRQEVILSAGSFNSPKLLLLSGIGPAADLAPLGIACREDLPVGRNLQDHLIVMLNWLTDRESMKDAWTPENLARWEEDGSGPMASNVGEGGAFIRTRSDLSAPDIQLTFCPVMLSDDFLVPPTDHAVSLGPVLLKPESRGVVSLRTSLPISKVRVRNDYLTTENDRRTMIDGVRASLEIAEQEAQEAAVLYYVDEMTQAEIAEELGRSLPTVRKRLREFLACARKALSESLPGIDLPEGDEP